MIKINFNEEEIETLKFACDLILKSSGVIKVKEISVFLDKLDQKDITYIFSELKLIQSLCDIILKNRGLLSLRDVVSILNKTAMTEITK